MASIQNALALFRRLVDYSAPEAQVALDATRDDHADDAPVVQVFHPDPGPDLICVTADEPATEYGDLLFEIGAEPPEDDRLSVLDMKDATIEALRVSLEELRGVGERMADMERELLSARNQIQGLEGRLRDAGQPTRTRDAQDGDDEPAEDVDAGLERALKAREKAEERLSAMRAKFEQKKAQSTERWKQIRSLRSERKQLTEELAAERKRWQSLQGPLRDAVAKPNSKQALASLAQLMQEDAQQPQAVKPKAKRKRSPSKKKC